MTPQLCRSARRRAPGLFPPAGTSRASTGQGRPIVLRRRYCFTQLWKVSRGTGGSWRLPRSRLRCGFSILSPPAAR
eukprot:9100229-Alexandrium_andersonii.AAC.1